MSNRQYVKPRALDNFSHQGPFTYAPVVFVIEENSVAALNTAINDTVSAQSQDPKTFLVIKDLQYSTHYEPPTSKYSVLIHAEIAERD